MRTTALAVLCLLAFTTCPFADENPSAPPASTEAVTALNTAEKPPGAANSPESGAKETTSEAKDLAASPESDPDQSGRDLSRAELCDALAASAQNNEVPVAFFTSLIWQESRFDTDSVSSAGAQGVAQFMPKVAQSLGLKDPFDPRAALRTSARLLRSLFEKFGNFGLAAAAYNAGPKRISDWLANRGKLPKETRDYVRIITGLPAEHWRENKIEVSFKLPERMPCPRVGVFADLPRASAASEASSEPKPVREKATAERTRKPADERRAQAKSASGANGKQAERKDERATGKHARARVLGRHNPKAEPARSNGRKQLIARQGSVKLASLADDERRPNASKRPRRS